MEQQSNNFREARRPGSFSRPQGRPGSRPHIKTSGTATTSSSNTRTSVGRMPGRTIPPGTSERTNGRTMNSSALAADTKRLKEKTEHIRVLNNIGPRGFVLLRCSSKSEVLTRKWLENRWKEFYSQSPEYNSNSENENFLNNQLSFTGMIHLFSNSSLV